jgi:hypothetical protein
MGQAPTLILNAHCRVCEFQQRCTAQAKSEDTISLLRGMSEKEVRKQIRKGIFTATQLSCTFRPRRSSKRAGRAVRVRPVNPVFFPADFLPMMGHFMSPSRSEHHGQSQAAG